MEELIKTLEEINESIKALTKAIEAVQMGDYDGRKCIKIAGVVDAK